MVTTKIGERREVPLWAALGVPLVGVPLLVALLAITAPRPEPVTEPGVTTEQVDVQPADHIASHPADSRVQAPKRC